MLVLSRKVNETVIIGQDITVTVVRVMGGNKVRLGITAPSEIPVDRLEVRNRQIAAARSAAGEHPADCMCVDCLPHPRG